MTAGLAGARAADSPAVPGLVACGCPLPLSGRILAPFPGQRHRAAR
ncbi:MAG: hypothetical protein ACRDPY_34810 [Streptosporangiaceae bacterium]